MQQRVETVAQPGVLPLDPRGLRRQRGIVRERLLERGSPLGRELAVGVRVEVVVGVR